MGSSSRTGPRFARRDFDYEQGGISKLVRLETTRQEKLLSWRSGSEVG